jgi:phenylalanyl-tRNA synthetase beta chain
VPSWRASKDISNKEDIAEEVVRIFGYDQIESTPLEGKILLATQSPEKTLRDTTLEFFRGNGWNEVYNYSFTNEETEEKILIPDMESAIRVQNAFNSEYTHLRRTLVANLLSNVRDHTNIATICQFFEIAKVYGKNISLEERMQKLLENSPQKPFGERKIIAGIMTGKPIESFKDTIESYLKKILGYIPQVDQNVSSRHPYLHPNITATYHIGEQNILTFGKIHPQTAAAYEINEETWYFDADFETLLLL